MSNRIEKTILLNAPLEKVWRALTDYKEFGQWFRVKIDGPFVPGQVSTGHMTYPGYEHVKWNAQIQQIDAFRYFSYTWHPYALDPKVDYSHETPTLVEFKLEAVEKGTRLTVIESGFDKLPPERFAAAFPKHEGGWEEQMENIQAHVES